ncbi:MAG: hypothetical protein AAFU85_16045 [Planctomycetota bacterium]
MAIEATCPNGHRLRIKSHWAGRAGRCPTCNASMRVPRRNAISDAEALDWIGDYVPPDYMRPSRVATVNAGDAEPSLA